MTFKERGYECDQCSQRTKQLRWDTDPAPTCACGGTLYEVGLSWHGNRGVIDDQIEGGPRWFENMGHEPVWIESKSQWRREMEKRGLVNVVRHDSAYYAKQRKRHDEELRDTGTNREY